MPPKIFTADEALSCAKAIAAERYAKAHFCIAAGSIIAGRGTAMSDLDLIVVYPHLDHAYRESFLYQDLPVEAFVHDYETLQSFIDSGIADSESTLFHMISTGIIFPEECDIAKKLRAYAAGKLSAGPAPLDEKKEKTLRYFITDLIDDLQGERTPQEQRAILYKLYPLMGELALRRAGVFVSTGKHLARKLEMHHPALLAVLDEVISAAHQAGLQPEDVEKLSNMLDSMGGRLFAGYHNPAPSERRAPPKWLD